MGEQSCRTCRYLDVPLDKLGRRIVRRDQGYRCIFGPLERPAWPDSVTESYGFRWPGNEQRGRRRMVGDDGENCPCWQKLDATR